MIYAGFDIGTSQVKAEVFSDGVFIAHYKESYSTIRNSNIQTVDIIAVEKAVKKLIKEVVDNHPKIKYIGIISFGESFVILDDKDQSLFDVPLYSDLRGREEAENLRELISDEEVGKITGHYINSMFSLAKIMYFKKSEPEKFCKADKILLIEDYFVYLLTGIRKIDYSLATRTMAFDINSLMWSKKILNLAGISPSLFSKPVETGTIVGSIKEEVATSLSIPRNIQIILIAHDQVANAVGGGAFKEGEALDGNGTCECLTPVFKGLNNHQDLCRYGYGIIPYIKKDLFVSYGLINTGGALVEWYLNTFFPGVDKKNMFTKLDKYIKDTPSDLFVLPYFAGAGTPYMNSLAKGSIINLTLATKKEDIYQAILESLGYELRLQIEKFRKSNVRIDSICASGGGAENRKWLQIKADITGLPIKKLKNIDAGTIGAGLIMGKTISLYKDYQEGVEKLIQVEEIFYPHEERHKKYNEKYRSYIGLYDSLVRTM